MKTNQTSPSGVRSRISMTAKSILHFPTGRMNLNPNSLRAMLVMLLFVLGIGEMWGGGNYNTALRTMVPTEDTGKGLVYANTSNEVAVTDATYTKESQSENVEGENGKNQSLYGWAKPARGYVFSKWVSYDIDPSNSQEKGCTPKANTGNADLIYVQSWAGGAGDDVVGTAKAAWIGDTPYEVTYMQPKGGSYKAQYNYLKVVNNKFVNQKEPLTLTPTSGNKRPLGTSEDEHDDQYSYAGDTVKLSVTENVGNFLGWYENGIKLSEQTTDYIYTVSRDAEVCAIFKWADIPTPEETRIIASSASEDTEATIDFEINLLGDNWDLETSDFTVQLQNKEGTGTLSVTNTEYTANILRVTVSYNANGNWDEGTNAEIKLTSDYSSPVIAVVKGFAEEPVDYEACVKDGNTTKTGTLVNMLAYANTLSSVPTLQIMNDVVATAPLQFKRSMVLDMNSKTLSSTTLNNLILVQGDNAADKIELTITDNSYLKAGGIHATLDANAAVEALRITDANKVTLNTVTIAATNINTAANAKAYSVHTLGTANFLMTSGNISATANHDAIGVYVEGGNATLQSGAITATAATQAYALYTAGRTNISSGITLTATTTTGNDAVAVCVVGETTVLDNVTMTAISSASNAYGAKVQAGKLILNGGAVTATTDADGGVYGAYIEAGAEVTIQQLATFTVEGRHACGIQNKGTLYLANCTIAATSPASNAVAISTESSAVTTVIEEGTYTATAATGYAYAIHHQKGALTIDGGSFIATSKGDYSYGIYAADNATLMNATLVAETKLTGKNAYGVAAMGAVDKTIHLEDCSIKAKSASSTAYALYNQSSLTVENSVLIAKAPRNNAAYGLYAKEGHSNLTNTSATVEAYTTDAYGIQLIAGILDINGGTFDVTVRQAAATAAADSKVYGIHVADDKTATLANATFNVTASNGSFSQNAYGAYTNTGTINSSACTYSVQAATKAYGIYGAGTTSTLSLRNNTVTATTTATTTAYGIYSNGHFTVEGDKVTSNTQTYTSYPLFFTASAEGEVKAGLFKAEGTSGAKDQMVAPVNIAADKAKVQIKGGFFNEIVQLQYYVPAGYGIYGVDPTVEEYADGYYYTVNDHLPYENVCYVTEAKAGFPTLEEAFDYARNHSDVTCNILMTQPYTLPAGNYSIPANATLVVPYKGSQTKAMGDELIHRAPNTQLIAENRLLTFAEGANVDVYGAIEVSAEQYYFNANSTGYVQGPYGRIHMEEGSTITLNNGANIYAWGYITGQGEIRVKNGAIVHEMFQMHDMKGSKDLDEIWTTSTNTTTYKAFPVNQYYIQNIEVPAKYYYGAKLLCSTGFTTNATSTSPIAVPDMKLVGNTDDYFFYVNVEDESSWVRKYYDAVNDRIIWEANSSASLGSMNINFSGYSMNSKDYVLPLTNNMTVHVLSGLFTITQSTAMLPGAEIEIDKTATLHINEKDTRDAPMGLYLYDQSNWAIAAKTIVYSPSWANGKCPRGTAVSTMKDAAIYVKGKIEVEGAIYTTAAGAAIYSDNTNAGTIEFSANAAEDGNIYPAVKKKSSSDATVVATYTYPVTSAQLRNGGRNGATFVATKNNAADGDTYAYADMDGDGTFTWTKLTTIDDCTIADVTDSENPVYYAKPQGYVAITSDAEDDNHLFHSVVGDRLFIQQGMESGCQWWEVTQVDESDVYYCATNDTYYEYEDEWQEVKRKVTFYFTDPESEDADKKKVLEVKYGAKPDATIVSNPSKEEDAAATYQFVGWKSSQTGTEYAYTATLETVTEDMYYLPVFTSIAKKYTVTFKDAKDGANVPVEVLYGTSPEYTATKASTAQYDYTFTGWDSSVHAEAGWTPIADGTETNNYVPVYGYYCDDYQRSQSVYPSSLLMECVGRSINALRYYVYNGSNSGKWDNVDFEVRIGITSSPNLSGGWIADSELTLVYTGKLTINSNIMEIIFSTPFEYIGGNLVIDFRLPDDVGYKAVSFYGISQSNASSYAYDGSSLDAALAKNGTIQNFLPKVDFLLSGYDIPGQIYEPNATLPAVTGPAMYTAQWKSTLRSYNITWKNGENIIEEDKDQPYGTESSYDDVQPSKAMDDNYAYAFSGWRSSLTGETYANGSTPIVEGETTYSAQFNATPRYVIRFMNYDGTVLQTAPVTAGETPVCAVVPRRERDATYYYVFTGWKNTTGVMFGINDALPAVTGKETYTAQYSQEDRMYIVTFANTDGAGASTETEYGYGAIPTFDGTPAKADGANSTFVFAGWLDESSELHTGMLPAVTGTTTYTASFTEVPNDMDIENSRTIPANTDYEVSTLHVHTGGILTIPATSTIAAENLIIDATIYKPLIEGAAEEASGQIIGTENISLTGNAYFDLTLNTDSRTWHAFGVPFEIGNLDNVKLIADGRTLTLGRDYDIIYYNGANRASQGPGAHCWEYVEDNGKTLTPGQGYMIAFTRAVNTVRFTKAADADLVYSASVRTKRYNSAIEGSNDWNAIATPALFHAALNAGVTYCQAHVPYEIGSDTYTPLQMADVNFVTGMSVYVQATANRAVTITPKPAAVPARRRAAANQSAKYEVTISTPNRTVPMDNLFIETTEEKENGYVTNQDLVKAGTSTKVAQMWVDRYDLKLCVNTMPVAEDGMAYYPLKIYVPQTGEYILNANNRNESETELYLTYDGEVVWNFANGIYTGHFEKGLSNHYGLRIGEKKAPEVATGFGEAVVDAHGKTTKVLIDGKVFIIREDRVYSIDGQLVK